MDELKIEILNILDKPRQAEILAALEDSLFPDELKELLKEGKNGDAFFPIGLLFFVNGSPCGYAYFYSESRCIHNIDEFSWEERGCVCLALVRKLQELGLGELAGKFEEELPEWTQKTVYEKYEDVLAELSELELEGVIERYLKYEEKQRAACEDDEPDFLLCELLDILKDRIAELAIDRYKSGA